MTEGRTKDGRTKDGRADGRAIGRSRSRLVVLAGAFECGRAHTWRDSIYGRLVRPCHGQLARVRLYVHSLSHGGGHAAGATSGLSMGEEGGQGAGQRPREPAPEPQKVQHLLPNGEPRNGWLQPNQLVAIIGGGIGGLATAYALQQAGYAARVYERDESFGCRRQGYGLTLSTTNRALADLGLLAELRARDVRAPAARGELAGEALD